VIEEQHIASNPVTKSTIHTKFEEYQTMSDYEMSFLQQSSFSWPIIILCVLLAVGVCMCVHDYDKMLELFNILIEWMKTHLHGSIFIGGFIVCVSIVIEIPIMYWVIMMSYSYAQVFNSQLRGFIFTVPIVFVGAMSGMVTTFVISRYFLRDYV